MAENILQRMNFDGHSWEIGYFDIDDEGFSAYGFRQDGIIVRITSKYEAELIAKVFNSHTKLVDALKKIRRGLEQDIKIHDSTFGDGTFIRDKDIKEYIDSITDVLDFEEA
jgi:hypothetical protein